MFTLETNWSVAPVQVHPDWYCPFLPWTGGGLKQQVNFLSSLLVHGSSCPVDTSAGDSWCPVVVCFSASLNIPTPFLVRLSIISSHSLLLSFIPLTFWKKFSAPVPQRVAVPVWVSFLIGAPTKKTASLVKVDWVLFGWAVFSLWLIISDLCSEIYAVLHLLSLGEPSFLTPSSMSPSIPSSLPVPLIGICSFLRIGPSLSAFRSLSFSLLFLQFFFTSFSLTHFILFHGCCHLVQHGHS